VDGAVGRASADDVLDAGACALTALRIVRGDVRCLPDPPEVDATGREMAIRV
jgi:predicted RNase H-like nuclease